MEKTLLYSLLEQHANHDVRISNYADVNMSLECEDCGSVIFDTDLYDLKALDTQEMDVWEAILKKLPHNPPAKGTEDQFPIWTDGTEILCRTEWLAKTIADIFDSLVGTPDGEFYSHYHYYDPEEDERNNEVDDHTGWWYVDFD